MIVEMTSEPTMAIGRSRLGSRLLRRGGHRVEADVGEEDDSCRTGDAGGTFGGEGGEVVSVEAGQCRDDEEEQDRQLDDHHGGVDPSALLGTHGQQEGDQGHDEDGRQVEDPAVLRALGDGVRERRALSEGGDQELVHVAAPADRDGGHRDAVLEDQVPADDEGDELAHGGVGEGVRTARDGHRGGELGVGQGREQAGHRSQHERQHQARTGHAGTLTDHDEDAGADDGPDAHGRQAEGADGLPEPFALDLGLGYQS
jgi:hypothetical protein